ncbi:hypothetical protein [Nocardiopsis sp. CNT312]|uniref:hypothetical protein n=1 Tax=Nocardiopsis sp. CNT312 TaxID=1137268 RepID=UPI0004BC84C8|nr:hypothetical protein [Nocardiopsis sp. CNT312]
MSETCSPEGVDAVMIRGPRRPGEDLASVIRRALMALNDRDRFAEPEPEPLPVDEPDAWDYTEDGEHIRVVGTDIVVPAK